MKTPPHLADGIHRSTYPDGTPSSVFEIRNGKMIGVSRTWHPNGQLAQETPYSEGCIHGTMRQWNVKGELLGSCEFQHGTGLARQWHDNGQLIGETSFYKGRMNGHMRVWDKDGMLYRTSFFFDGRPISKKGYLEKCASMPELPRFEEVKTTNTLGNYVRKLNREKRAQAKLGPTPEQLAERARFEEECKTESKARTSRELLGWLTKNPKAPRELGELSRAKALKLARKLYELGARKVWATGVESDSDGAEYSNKLIIALPTDTAAKGKIYALLTDPARPWMDGSGPAIRMETAFLRVSLL
jgi:hypothetical protein